MLSKAVTGGDREKCFLQSHYVPFMMHIHKMFGSTGENQDPLSWDSRVQIALDVARGLEYLHYGVCFVLIICQASRTHSCTYSSSPVLTGSSSYCAP
jgi:hypothetical protein